MCRSNSIIPILTSVVVLLAATPQNPLQSSPPLPTPVAEKIANLHARNDKLKKRLSRSLKRKRSPKRKSTKQKKAAAIEYASMLFTGLSLQFFISQLLLSGGPKKRQRYSDSLKGFALSSIQALWPTQYYRSYFICLAPPL